MGMIKNFQPSHEENLKPFSPYIKYISDIKLLLSSNQNIAWLKIYSTDKYCYNLYYF